MSASPFLFSSSRIVTGATRDELLVYLDKCGGIVRKEMQCSVCVCWKRYPQRWGSVLFGVLFLREVSEATERVKQLSCFFRRVPVLMDKLC